MALEDGLEEIFGSWENKMGDGGEKYLLWFMDQFFFDSFLVGSDNACSKLKPIETICEIVE